MKKRLIALALCLVMLATCLGAGMLAPTPVTLVDENGAEATSAAVPQLGRKTLKASYAAATETTGYQWQFSNDGDTWIDIYGETAQTCSLSYAKVKNMLDADGKAQLRCVVTDGEDERVSSAATVTVDYSAQTAEAATEAQSGVSLKAAPARAASYARSAAPQSDDATCSVMINYVFEDETQAANPWTATIAKGSSINQSVTSPTVLGYEPDQAEVVVNVTDIQDTVTYTVRYSPALVEFTVEHYQQNVSNDYYTLSKTETKDGYTESAVGENLAINYEGFYSLLYDTSTKIAADGSTVVKIYYDRLYYLMSFDLDGGYGVEPIYARFGAPISVDESALEKPGYTFGGWDKTIPATMPADNTSYTASWNKCGDTAFTVAFYYENADDNGYTFMDSKVYQGTTGDRVSGSAYKDENFSGKDTKHFTYLDGKTDKNVEIKGDGSTVVKVYFSRKVYTMEFYGITCGQKESWWHSHSQKCCKKVTDSFSAKYNANIAQQYAGITQNHRWLRWDAEACTALVSYMPDDSNPNALKYWQNSDGDTVYNITYAYESENGTTNHDGKKFTALATSHVPMSYVGYSDDYLPAVRNGYSAYKDYSKAASPVFPANGQIYETNVTLYYYANTYTLRFMNAETQLRTANVKYNFSIKSNSNFTPDESLAPNGMVFDCWCLDPAGAQPVDWNAQKMPAGDLVLYARWKPVSHTVEFYLDHAALNAGTKLSTHPDVTVRHGSKATPTPAEPKNGSYTFVGWFYMENGVEKAFDFANMPVNKDMQVYGKWSSNVRKQYTIYYKIQGTDTEIAAPTTGSGLAGVTKTFDAKGGTQLNEGYQSGYFPTTNSHSMTMDIDGNNEYTFVYVPKEEVPYTVRYLEQGTGTQLFPENNVKTRDAIITETFVAIKGYVPDAYQKRLVLSANEEENVITFWYTKDDVHAPVQIIHWIQNIAGDGYTEYQSSTNLNGVIGDPYSETPLTIAGFVYNSGKSNASGTLTAAGLVLNLYYDRVEYPYEFRFLEQGTDKVLEPSATGTARYQAQVTYRAKTIPGYTLVSEENQAINIAIEDPAATANKNVRVFYYTENEVTINYVAVGPDGVTDFGSVSPTSETVKVLTGTAQGSTATASSNTYRFVGWYDNEACTGTALSTDAKYVPQKGSDGIYAAATYYAKFEYNLTNLTIRKNASPYDANDMFIFTVKDSDGKEVAKVTLKAGESVTIKNLTVGETYTVTEDTSWSWRYTTDDATKTITLEPTGNVVTVKNTLDNNNWLGASSYAINRCVKSVANQVNKIIESIFGN